MKTYRKPNEQLFSQKENNTSWTLVGHATDKTLRPQPTKMNSFKKVQVGKDQKRCYQKKIPTPKTEAGKNQTNNQVRIP